MNNHTKSNNEKCPECGKPMHRINPRDMKNKRWRCTNPDCKIVCLTEREMQ